MAEMKHTTDFKAEKWRVGTTAGGYNANTIYGTVGGNEQGVASVYGIAMHRTLEEVEQDDRDTVGLARARLMAAAPELLDACRPVIGAVDVNNGDFLDPTWNPDAHVELTLTIAEVRAIHAALAKAQGKD